MFDYRRTDLIVATVFTIVVLCILVVVGLKATPEASEIERVTTPTSSSESSEIVKGLSSVIFGADGIVTPSLVITTSTPRPSAGTPVTVTAAPSVSNVTPTPVRVVIGTQKRSLFFFPGTATYVRSDAFAPLPLTSFPRPKNDNGRGLHWFPTTWQTHAVVDRFVPELTAMKIRWVVILQGMNNWDLAANEYLIGRLNAAGIMPVMRIVAQVGAMDLHRLAWIVAHYRERGVRYFQIFNEPNVDDEWSAPTSHTPEQFVAFWAPAAQVVAENGGFPGLSPMSSQRDDSDLVFFSAALEELKRTGRYDLLNVMWISVHNYGGMSADGFWRYRLYDAGVKKVLGASLPILITEGGMETADATAQVIVPMYRFVEREREPNLLAFAPWLIGNAVGDGHDAQWESAAWFTGTLDQVQPRAVVAQAKDDP